MRRAITAGLLLLILAGVTGQARQEGEPPRLQHFQPVVRIEASAEWREDQCRFKQQGGDRAWSYHKIVLTIECAAEALDPIGGLPKVLNVWGCESGWGVEPPHTDSYHGPFQYLRSTFHSQQSQMPGVVGRYDLPRRVHSPRANILTAVGWARWSWRPWAGCA